MVSTRKKQGVQLLSRCLQPWLLIDCAQIAACVVILAQVHVRASSLPLPPLCVPATGRSKDTIVLINGKNVSPQPIEDMVSAEASATAFLLLMRICPKLALEIERCMLKKIEVRDTASPLLRYTSAKSSNKTGHCMLKRCKLLRSDWGTERHMFSDRAQALRWMGVGVKFPSVHVST
eukprot:scaffold65562_cov18-Tisochrysis_lutea.AAC.1